MRFNIMVAFVFFVACSSANADKSPPAPPTEEQCRKSVEKSIDDHKSLSNPTDPSKVADDSFVSNLRKIQQTKGNCEAYNQLLDSYN